MRDGTTTVPVSGQGDDTKRQIRVLVANRPKFKLMCESKIERFADYIAIVGGGADIGVGRIEAAPPDFLYTAGVRCDTSHHRVDGPDRSQRQVLSDM